jgi:hypothetical protein
MERAVVIAAVWDASFERRRRLGAPRAARSDPGLASRLSRIAMPPSAHLREIISVVPRRIPQR